MNADQAMGHFETKYVGHLSMETERRETYTK